MRSNRGSAAVISIVFMMFLLIIGIGFMPLMNSEVKHASMDMDEQKAWYAAEAGIKYAKAYQNDASEIKAILGTSTGISEDNNAAAYQLTMKDKTDGSAVTSSTSGFPVADKTYIVYSEGTFNGVKKVITEEFVFATGSSSGGENGGGSTATGLEGLMHAGGTVTFANGGIGSVSGGVYATDVISPDYLKLADNNQVHKQSADYYKSLYTKISSDWFITEKEAIKSSEKLSDNTWEVSVPAGETMYTSKLKNEHKLIGYAGSRLYMYNDTMSYISNIVGPSGDSAPFVIVCENGIDKGNLGITGNVVIIANSAIKITSWGIYDGKVMIFSNGDIKFLSGLNVYKGFISSNQNIVYEGGSFTGQMQARGNINVNYSGAITFDNTVLKAYGIPQDITTN